MTIEKKSNNLTFIAQQVAGRFASVSETVRAGLRLLEERELKLRALQDALKENEQSGLADYPLDSLTKELDGKTLNPFVPVQ